MYKRFLFLNSIVLMLFTTAAQAQIPSIVVHALNPEGVEIASIEGMDPRCVEIYDGDTLIGYGAHDSKTHNVPIKISTGIHTIKVNFNDIELSQTILLNRGDVKIMTFTFPRTEFYHQAFLNSIGKVSASRTFMVTSASAII